MAEPNSERSHQPATANKEAVRPQSANFAFACTLRAARE
jgi:hypothetical protein